jgi:CBS domain containing-hemolysin-like protein
MNKYLLLALGLPGISFLISALVAEGLPQPSTVAVPGLVITLLLAFNGLCVAAEFAIISIRPTQIEEMIEAGNKKAIDIMAILSSTAKQDRYIATAQLGITIASLGLGMYGELQIAHFIEPYLASLLGTNPHMAVIHSVGYIISLSLLTYLHVVFGEMIPKSLALLSSRKMVLFIIQPMKILQAIFAIPVLILNAIGTLMLKLFRVPPASGEDLLHSPEELEVIVSESAEGGLLNQEEEEWILNIFDFGDRQVNQVMTPRRKIQAIAYDTPLPELLKQVAESEHSRFPVYKDDLDHIIGILHLKELVRHHLNNQGIDLGELIQEVPIVPEYYPVEKLLTIFKRQRIHMAVVLDEFGGTAGIVTLEDLVEEVVGEVRDEFDKELEPVVKISPGVLETEGSYLIDDLVDNLTEDVKLGDEEELPDVETVGGLIMAKLGRPPEVGDKVVYNQVRFTVLTTDGLAVERARIEYPALATEDNNEAVEVST